MSSSVPVSSSDSWRRFRCSLWITGRRFDWFGNSTAKNGETWFQKRFPSRKIRTAAQMCSTALFKGWASAFMMQPPKSLFCQTFRVHQPRLHGDGAKSCQTGLPEFLRFACKGKQQLRQPTVKIGLHVVIGAMAPIKIIKINLALVVGHGCGLNNAGVFGYSKAGMF